MCAFLVVQAILEPGPFQQVVCMISVPLLLAVLLARRALESMDTHVARFYYSRAVAVQGVVGLLFFVVATAWVPPPNGASQGDGALQPISTPGLVCGAAVVM